MPEDEAKSSYDLRDSMVRIGRRATDVKPPDAPRPGPADSSFRVAASPQVSYALILALVGAYGSGAWFLATQNATNMAVADRLARFEAAAGARFDVIDKRAETRDTALAARFEGDDRRNDARNDVVARVDIRLARLEAQVAYLATAGGTKR